MHDSHEEEVDLDKYHRDAARKADKGEWWVWPLLVGLTLVDFWIIWAWRGVGVAAVLIIGAALVMIVPIQKWWFTFLVGIVTSAVLVVYIIVMFNHL